MFGTLEFSYKGRNGHWYRKEMTAAEIRRAYKRVKPVLFNVFLYTDEGFMSYWNTNDHNCLQARSVNYIGTVAERYNGVTKIGCYPPYEYTNC